MAALRAEEFPLSRGEGTTVDEMLLAGRGLSLGVGTVERCFDRSNQLMKPDGPSRSHWIGQADGPACKISDPTLDFGALQFLYSFHHAFARTRKHPTTTEKTLDRSHTLSVPHSEASL